MAVENIIEVIEKVELFRGLTAGELIQFATMMEEIELSPKEFLFKEHMPREALYIVESGEIELTRNDKFGGSQRIVSFEKYDFLSEGALLDDSPHSTSAKAVIRTRIYKIRREAFLDLFKNNSEIAKKILAGVGKVIARRMRRITELSTGAAAQYASGRTRSEHDLLGNKDVPDEAYYGIQTLRGLENFHITGVPLSHYPVLIEALAMVKLACARANADLGLLPQDVAGAIIHACEEIINGKFHGHFALDMIQGGAGTSTNMNANEVIANRAIELLGHERGQYEYVHPNNHVNLGQSTNDAYPSALKIAMALSNGLLVTELEHLIGSFRRKGKEFAHILKMGRTQLQDAVPMTLGQEFEAWAQTLSDEIQVMNQNAYLFMELNMGGTAIGTGLNAAPEFGEKVISYLYDITGIPVENSSNLIEETQSTSAFVAYSSALKHMAIKLSKICNDLRLLSSGPRAGFNEINLPPMQPGSSIMPGKVNPVIPEVVNQVAFKVIGDDLTVTLAAEAGQLQLNVMEPVIADCIFESIEMLRNAMVVLRHRCIDGITANEDVCRMFVQNSIGLVTALNPVLGYETSTELAKEALENNRGIYELVLEKGLLSREELDRILDPKNMLRPQLESKIPNFDDEF